MVGIYIYMCVSEFCPKWGRRCSGVCIVGTNGYMCIVSVKIWYFEFLMSMRY
jgi:hypothetical protein